MKIEKVRLYWDRSSLLVPNVFRMLTLLEDDSKNFLEYQDLSRKELLVQSNGQKAKTNINNYEAADSNDEALSLADQVRFGNPIAKAVTKKNKQSKNAAQRP